MFTASRNRRPRTRPGFTLVELLVVMTIIGLLTSIATVSYSSSRMKARDAKRLGDLDAVRTALELYDMDAGGFPADRLQGSDGLTLGREGATKLTSAGWTDTAPKASEQLYLDKVPFNPAGGGAEYVYYSLNRDGSDCDIAPCPDFRIEFALESPVTGASDRPAGPYVMNASSTSVAPPDIAARIDSRTTLTGVDAASARVMPVMQQAAAAADSARQATIGNPVVQGAAETVVAPVSTAATAVSALTGLSSVAGASSAGLSSVVGISSAAASGSSSVAAFTTAATTAASGAGAVQTAAASAATAGTAASAASELGSLIYLLFTQPFMLLRKRKEYSWGIVYDSQKKLPIDLAIVRLIDDETGRLVQTRVTDKNGRIFFFAPKGTYRLEAAKAGYAFPAKSLSGEREDGRFANLYFGQRFTVGGSGQVINPSIPLDPAGYDAPDSEFVKRFVRGKLRYAVSLTGLILTMAAFAVKPTVQVGGLFALNLALYYVFRRISYPKQPPEWGIVRDEKTGEPIAHAVLRLFSSPYNKLVETKVADGHGRYNFLVGQNIYYITATSGGYWKTESFPIDLRGSEKPQVISAPVRLRPLTAEAEERLDESGKKV